MEIGPIVRALTRNRTRVLLIVLQIAITLAVVTNAVNMIATERTKMKQASGFDDDNLLWVFSRPFADSFGDRAFRITTTRSDVRALRTIPGVKSVVNTNFIPWQGGGSSGEVKAAGGDGSSYRTQEYTASPAFTDTLGVKIVSGRNIGEGDINDEPNATTANVIISRGLERLIFKGQSAVGKQFIEPDNSVDTIVGVFDPFYNPYGWPIHEYCLVYPGTVARNGALFLVRVNPGAMKSVSQAVEKKLLSVNDGRNFEMRTISEVRDKYFTEGRIVIMAMTAVIILIVIVTGLGIVGVTSFSVTERKKQIGTRRALGATKSAILRYFLMENWLITNSGVLLGILLAYGLNYLLVTHTSGVKLDWRYLIAGVTLLWVQGIVATLVPAMRAAAVSPVIATRGV
ncbi:MAG: macB 13 [Acidobacteria bacterium]|nr:macB 13 [Acidobacteriota bacterium]